MKNIAEIALDKFLCFPSKIYTYEKNVRCFIHLVFFLKNTVLIKLMTMSKYRVSITVIYTNVSLRSCFYVTEQNWQ